MGGDYSLTIQDLQVIDSGIYVVTAVNQIGTDTDEVEIEVLGKKSTAIFLKVVM